MKKIVIQPKSLPDLTLPYPYYILENGDVDRQDFWKGDPAALLGFQNDIEVQQVDLLCEDWWAEPHSAIGKHAVFVEENGNMWAHKQEITGVRILDPDAPDGYPDGPVNPLGWAEAKPLGVRPGGDAGGDEQVGESWCRRFVKRGPDGEWSVVTVYFYVAQPGLRTGDDNGEQVVTQQTEYLVCTDPADPGATEQYSDYTYATVGDLLPEIGIEVPRELCEDFNIADITWDGRRSPNGSPVN